MNACTIYWFLRFINKRLLTGVIKRGVAREEKERESRTRDNKMTKLVNLCPSSEPYP